jgi:outer membrane immunogenic protein
MKLGALVFSVLALSAASAMAADMPLKARPVIVDPVYSWTGFYVGGNAGYSWGRSRSDSYYYSTTTGTQIATPPGSVFYSPFNVNGAIAGGQVGYNWQIGGSVWGLEADAQWSGERGSTNFSCVSAAGGVCFPGVAALPAGVPGATVAMDQSLQWFGTVRGRVGALVTPKVLLYGTVGLAYGDIKTSATFTGVSTANAVVSTTGSSSHTRVGWTAGAGVEGAFAPNWTAKAEYLYMDLGSFDSSNLSLAPLASAVGVNLRSSFSDHIVRLGINYKLTGP